MRLFCILSLLFVALSAVAQTDYSLFWRKDSVQIEEIISDEAVQYKKVGHHGPAVENSYMALRLYFNDSGAIDIYSKANPGLELRKYLWYPTKDQIAAGAGCDEYRVGKSVGLGGISLWDTREKCEVKLVATKGREARVRRIEGGAQMEMLSKGVAYMGEMVDIRVRVTVRDNDRTALIEADCVSGQSVQFMTGVNHHNGQQVDIKLSHNLIGSKPGLITVWGVHPADVVENPLPIGAALQFNMRAWNALKPCVEKTDDMCRIVSKKATHAEVQVMAACSREIGITDAELFQHLAKMTFK
ncbi:MAG: DUF4861 family protein [Marinilabiliaceae bacterium]|nr:DUF4861 family protein [Marinilabiliaceae bacterium]